MAESILNPELIALAQRVVDENRRMGRTFALAESCTGGLVSAAITEIPGSSEVFEASFVTYSNEIKNELLKVSQDVLETFGSVSIATAWAMAQGALTRTHAHIAVAITGIAGPDGGTAEKPVGTVHIAVADDRGTRHLQLQLRGDRGTLQRGAASWAHKLLWDRLCERGVASLHGPTPSPAT